MPVKCFIFVFAQRAHKLLTALQGWAERSWGEEDGNSRATGCDVVHLASHKFLYTSLSPQLPVGLLRVPDHPRPVSPSLSVFFLFTLPDWQRLNELRKLMCNFGSDFSLLFFLAYLTGKFICISGIILFLFCALPLYDRLIANTPMLPAF